MSENEFLWLWVALVMCGMWITINGPVKLIWQSPRIFWHAGLYIKVGNKRYRLLRVGAR